MTDRISKYLNKIYLLIHNFKLNPCLIIKSDLYIPPNNPKIKWIILLELLSLLNIEPIIHELGQWIIVLVDMRVLTDTRMVHYRLQLQRHVPAHSADLSVTFQCSIILIMLFNITKFIFLLLYFTWNNCIEHFIPYKFRNPEERNNEGKKSRKIHGKKMHVNSIYHYFTILLRRISL
jgi:hypothetical protein